MVEEEVQEIVGFLFLVPSNSSGEPLIDIERLFARYRVLADNRVLEEDAQLEQGSRK